MFEKNMRLAYLLDFYVDILDDHSANIMRAYYEDDLSLAEIAAVEGISRQGIRHVIKKCEEQILFLEEKLSLAEKHFQTQKGITALEKIADSITDTDKKENLYEVIKILNKGV